MWGELLGGGWDEQGAYDPCGQVSGFWNPEYLQDVGGGIYRMSRPEGPTDHGVCTRGFPVLLWRGPVLMCFSFWVCAGDVFDVLGHKAELGEVRSSL